MARRANVYVCQECGASQSRWGGRCDACGAWNSIVEEAPAATPPRGLGAGKGRPTDLVGLAGTPLATARRTSGISEFDRVTGGGLVPGSALLIGGDPGIGKSTLVLQVAAALSPAMTCVYISGEEAVDQVRLRAARLDLAGADVKLAAVTNVRDILATLAGVAAPALVIVDSIQTMYVDSLDSSPGTVAQLRAASQALIGYAKRGGATVILVGHVTKEGLIAGPRVLEHMVDTVLYFEGDRGHQFRILRAVKNRFGPTDEIGVFEMTGTGLVEVPNPSALFLADRRGEVAGSAVFAGIEGSRPVLVEIQALCAPSALATPRRAVVGWDSGRLAMIIAVLEARCGLALSGYDVYLNVAGGLRVGEPAADLAVAGALVSARLEQPVPADAVLFGEVGLSGEIRAVSQAGARLKEAAKLGFARAWVPPPRGPRDVDARAGVEIAEIAHLADLVSRLRDAAD
ncbi:MAG: DNA repair protein RadA [Alphaproteobacteria bacterium]